MAGPTISAGDMYGRGAGSYSAVSEASGPVEAGASPALFWVAAIAILVVIRLIWESAD